MRISLFFLFIFLFFLFGNNDTLKTKKLFAIKTDLITTIYGATKKSYKCYTLSVEKFISNCYSLQLGFIHNDYANNITGKTDDIFNELLLEFKYFFNTNTKSSFFIGPNIAYVNQGFKSIYPHDLYIFNGKPTKSAFNNSISAGLIGGYQFRIKRRIIIGPKIGFDYSIYQSKNNGLTYGSFKALFQIEFGIAF